MNDYQEYRSYSSYLSRVFAIIIAFLLLVFAIWGVVRLASDDDATLGDTKSPSFSEDGTVADNSETDGSTTSDQDDAQDANDEPDLFVSGDVAGDTTTQAEQDASQDAQGQTLSTNTDIATNDAAQDGSAVAGATTDGLPSTGAGDLSLVLGLGAVAFIGSKLYFSNLN